MAEEPAHTPSPVPLDVRHHAVLQVEYDGTDLVGWSRQPGLRSVEEALREAFATTGATVADLRCAGRTDAGVHATGQVVGVAYDGGAPPDRLVRALGALLPADIGVVRAAACEPGFDARNDARSRTYRYRVLPTAPPAPLRRRVTLHHPRPLHRPLLDAAADAVVGQHDFTAFTPSDTAHVFFHRTVLTSAWTTEGDELVYTVRANAFLRHMVRVLVGTMLAVGRGEVEPDRMRYLLAGATRSEAGPTAPPHGLCLVDVEYRMSPFG